MAKAAESGVTTVALVDHDTLAGIPEAQAAADHHNLTLIPGTELSVSHGSLKLHMLVYFLEPTDGPLQDRLKELRHGRDARNSRIVERLAELGYRITLDDVLTHANGESVGRPHVADALVAAGHFQSRQEVFEHLLHDGGPAYVERDRLSALDAIALARSAGAVPVVAHPITITPLRSDDVIHLFSELCEGGLGGIEAHHPKHPPEYRAKITAIAHSLGIAATGGSDYHGTGKPGYRIGSGRGDLRVPASAVEELVAQRHPPR